MREGWLSSGSEGRAETPIVKPGLPCRSSSHFGRGHSTNRLKPELRTAKNDASQGWEFGLQAVGEPKGELLAVPSLPGTAQVSQHGRSDSATGAI